MVVCDAGDRFSLAASLSADSLAHATRYQFTAVKEREGEGEIKKTELVNIEGAVLLQSRLKQQLLS
jgi:hypothetical protein